MFTEISAWRNRQSDREKARNRQTCMTWCGISTVSRQLVLDWSGIWLLVEGREGECNCVSVWVCLTDCMYACVDLCLRLSVSRVGSSVSLVVCLSSWSHRDSSTFSKSSFLIRMEINTTGRRGRGIVHLPLLISRGALVCHSATAGSAGTLRTHCNVKRRHLSRLVNSNSFD